MKRYRLETTPFVIGQLREQVLHIARDSIDRALAWEARMLKAIHGLSDFSGYAIDEDATARLGYPVRKLVFERTYLIHFTIDDSAGIIYVVGFRHGARLPQLGEP